MYNANDIAIYVINYSSNITKPINNLKLQKILYFIQADFLKNTGNACFKEEIEAWDFGPVVPEVYNQYKRYGSSIIPKINKYIDINKGVWNSKECIFDENIILLEDRERINKIIKLSSNYSNLDLMNIIKNQSPWKNSRKSYCKIISKNVIFTYFK